jgi:NTE family protein
VATTPHWAADSPATGADLQPTACGDKLRGAVPPPSPDPVAVAFSGGGFRATLPALGVARMLAGLSMLDGLRYASSVSGGSVANGLLAVNWPKLRKANYSAQAVDEHVIDPFVRRISSDSLKVALIRNIWRAAGGKTRTHVLARQFDEWFYDDIELVDLDPEVRWIVNAANLVSGVRFAFERDVVGDYTVGNVPTAGTGLRLSLAVASSAAVPGAFAPVRLTDIAFPCATEAPALLDGGAYDNSGIEAIDSSKYRHAFLVAINAGGLLRPGAYGKVPLVRELARSNALLYRQTTALRARTMVDEFLRAPRDPSVGLEEGQRRGVLFGLATDVEPKQDERGRLDEWRAVFPERRTHDGAELATFPTVFDKLDRSLCVALVDRGWWLTGACIALHHPHRLPADLRTLDRPA